MPRMADNGLDGASAQIGIGLIAASLAGKLAQSVLFNGGELDLLR